MKISKHTNTLDFSNLSKFFKIQGNLYKTIDLDSAYIEKSNYILTKLDACQFTNQNLSFNIDKLSV
jgi:hypothetical protein